MVKVIYVEQDGARHDIDVPEGWTVMQGAQRNGLDGIEAECGGSCCCATCHVYVAEDMLGLIPPPGEMEDGMLDNVVAERRPNSRLSCQITLTAALDGLVVHLPEAQS
ncbi:2Fe-2S iron-sulfur cluster-binding protein [Telmatospirillum sp. J64-1]|uniref:2Fe-2S iron-sulfur cluster-binding protein n=1 Tax=Telmatospirillum sp. J64-1 TaxID=2502183 RepID=UPI00115D2CEB|nr:2Fe-2S iron-sulfur cluster-binding protein [Telmatospirillum sp. J64-1]